MSFDLDALEVEGEDAPPFEFTYKGEKFTMPAATSMGWQDQLALETATNIEALRIILGDQFERFQALPMSASRLGKLIEEWQRHQGLSPGESAASSPS